MSDCTYTGFKSKADLDAVDDRPTPDPELLVESPPTKSMTGTLLTAVRLDCPNKRFQKPSFRASPPSVQELLAALCFFCFAGFWTITVRTVT